MNHSSPFTTAASAVNVSGERPVLSSSALNDQARRMLGGSSLTDGLGPFAALRMAREKAQVTGQLRSDLLRLTHDYALDLTRHQFANELAQRKYEISAEANLKLASLQNEVMRSGYAWMQALQGAKQAANNAADASESQSLLSLREKLQRGEITEQRHAERVRQIEDDYNALFALHQQFDGLAKVSVVRLLELTLSQPQTGKG